MLRVAGERRPWSDGSMRSYEYVTINVSGSEEKHVSAFNETINRYAAQGWTVAQMVRPSVIGPLGVLFERDADDR